MRERDLCGKRGSGPGEVGSDAGDAGARNHEGTEGEGRAFGGEGRDEAEDWVSARVIKAEWPLKGPGRVVTDGARRPVVREG